MNGGMVSQDSGATPVGKRGWPSAGIACTLGARGAAPCAPFGRSAQATGSAVGAATALATGGSVDVERAGIGFGARAFSSADWDQAELWAGDADARLGVDDGVRLPRAA